MHFLRKASGLGDPRACRGDAPSAPIRREARSDKGARLQARGVDLVPCGWGSDAVGSNRRSFEVQKSGVRGET